MSKSLLTSFVFGATVVTAAMAQAEPPDIRKLTLQELKNELEKPLPEKCDLIAQFNKQSGSLEISLKKDGDIIDMTVDAEPSVYAFLAKNDKGEWFNLYQYSKESGSLRSDLFLQTELYGKRTTGLRIDKSEKVGEDWVVKSKVDCSANPKK